VHHLSATLALDARDRDLTLQNYEGEEAWISGGVPLAPAWVEYNTTQPHGTCEAQCKAAGHCCEGAVSSYNHPSCAMGCAMVAAGAKSVAECKAACVGGDNTCAWHAYGIDFNNCENCPKGCDASDGVSECELGCELAFGQGGPNIWVADVPSAADGGPAEVEGLFTLGSHERFTRARWPNPNSGTEELRPAARVSPKRFLPPRVKPKAKQVYAMLCTSRTIGQAG
jgi:hypothetical protein